VAFVEVGYLGYFTPNPIEDLAGVVTPDAVPDVRRGDFAAAFFRHRPDVLVYLPDFDWALGRIVSDPRFLQAYQAVGSLPGPGARPFTLYRRANRPLVALERRAHRVDYGRQATDGRIRAGGPANASEQP
jgi:hypothetical protein